MENLIGSLVPALILSMVYILGNWLHQREEENPWRRRRISLAAGVSVAYVFLDLLPELSAQHGTFLEAAGGEEVLFAEQRIYLLALISFVVIYGLEYMVLSKREERREVVSEGKSDGVYLLHLAGFAAYSAMIGYLLIERAERGTFPLIVYTIAMAVHFLIVDHSLGEEHDGVYNRSGHWILAASVMIGWVIGLLMPFSESVFARLFAVLAGGVVITSLKAELPDRKGKFWAFSIGALIYGLLLIFA
jgi:hypothetical protein